MQGNCQPRITYPTKLSRVKLWSTILDMHTVNYKQTPVERNAERYTSIK